MAVLPGPVDSLLGSEINIAHDNHSCDRGGGLWNVFRSFRVVTLLFCLELFHDICLLAWTSSQVEAR